MSHKEVIPLDHMGQWVQDALDAIEYANGPENSVWASRVQKNGHPKPFNLKYLEIGNENGGTPYAERWPLFSEGHPLKNTRISSSLPMTGPEAILYLTPMRKLSMNIIMTIPTGLYGTRANMTAMTEKVRKYLLVNMRSPAVQGKEIFAEP